MTNGKEQYERVKRCYKCDGYDRNCQENPAYITNRYEKVCGWRETIVSDVQKYYTKTLFIKRGETDQAKKICMTFPVLETIINEEVGK